MALTFTWVDPVVNVDGSPIVAGELTGYTLSVGTSPGVYTIDTSIADPTATSEPVANLSAVLAPGTYFAVIKAESDRGESPVSNEVSFTVAPPPPPSPPSAPSNFAVG